jgi:hypothetical protein
MCYENHVKIFEPISIEVTGKIKTGKEKICIFVALIFFCIPVY